MKYNYLSYSFNYIKIEVKIIVYCFFRLCNNCVICYICILIYFRIEKKFYCFY